MMLVFGRFQQVYLYIYILLMYIVIYLYTMSNGCLNLIEFRFNTLKTTDITCFQPKKHNTLCLKNYIFQLIVVFTDSCISNYIPDTITNLHASFVSFPEVNEHIKNSFPILKAAHNYCKSKYRIILVLIITVLLSK